MAPSLIQLPTEILEAIFLHLDPPSLVSASQTCKFIKRVTLEAPILWRHLCQTHYKSWAPHHDIAIKLASPLSDVDWRSLFIQRKYSDQKARRLLSHVLETQHCRLEHINHIADLGFDVKELLLREIACPDEAQDVLARKFYATEILQRIQREMAICLWKDLQGGKNIPMETGLGAYDLFTRTGDDVDIAEFSSRLDQVAQRVLNRHPDFSSLNSRQKASTLASELREQGFRGVPHASYRALRNSFIGIVLNSSDHESLPLISVAIYCSVARRLGLDARPCGFLFHVYTLIYAPKDYTLDGTYKPTSSDDRDFMYLDPFRSSDEVYQHDLQRVLREMGVPTSEHDSFLTSSRTEEMVLRTARNIMNSVQLIRQSQAGVAGVHNINPSWINAFPDIDNAFYATIWALLILGPNETGQAALTAPVTRQRQYLPYLLEHFQIHYPWDITLVENYVVPMFQGYNPEETKLRHIIFAAHAQDRMPKTAKRRSNGTSDVKFKVGQVFRHKRYHYEGVITGWDTNCAQDESWIQHMAVDRLAHGRDQAFYHVL